MDEKQFGQIMAAIEGLGDRLSNLEKDVTKIRERVLNAKTRFDQQEEQTHAIIETQLKIYELIARLVEKDELQDYQLWKLEKRLGGEK
jgi:hypothetical protein